MQAFQNISKYRTFLMGIAMMMVFLYHDGIMVSLYHDGENWMPIVAEKIVKHWYLGVDVFFFLSAIGLTYSMKKNPNVWAFYKRRIVRIFPAFWLVMTGVYLSKYAVMKIMPSVSFHIPQNVWEIFLAYSTLGYWLPKPFFFLWYIPATLGLYLVFPLVNKLYARSRIFYALTIVPSVGISILNACNISVDFWHNSLLTRIGIFLWGGVFAREFLMRNWKDTTKRKIIIYSIGILAFIFYALRLTTDWLEMRYWNRVAEEAVFFVTLPCMLVCLCRFTKFRYIEKPFALLGRLSLEFYLVHEFLMHIFGALQKRVYPIWPSIEALMTFLCSLAAAYLVHALVNRLLQFNKKNT